MRITNNMLSANLLSNLTSAQNRVNDLQNQLSTGLKISKPSDDPVGIENVLHIKSSIANVDQWKNNADEAVTQMETTDTILDEINSMVQRIRELTVEASSDALSVDGREAIASEVDELTNQLKDLANTQVGSRYIFGGTRSDQEPLPVGTSTWLGNNQSIDYQVGNNNNMSISVNGQTLFTTPITNSSGYPTAGIFDNLDQLSTLLHASTSTGINISGMLSELDGQVDNILAMRADLGARTNRMSMISEHLDAMSANFTENLAGIQDADMAQTIIEFTNQQNVYKAALSVGAQIIQPSLVDFIK